MEVNGDTYATNGPSACEETSGDERPVPEATSGDECAGINSGDERFK